MKGKILGVWVTDKTNEAIEKLIQDKHYATKSDFLRAIIRKELEKEAEKQ